MKEMILWHITATPSWAAIKNGQKTEIFNTDGSLMKAKVLQNALLEHSATLLTCIKLYSVLKTNFWSFLSGRLRQVLLYIHCCTYPYTVSWLSLKGPTSAEKKLWHKYKLADLCLYSLQIFFKIMLMF